MTNPSTIFDIGLTLLGIGLTIWVVGPMTLGNLAAFCLGLTVVLSVVLIIESIFRWCNGEFNDRH